MKTCEEIRMDWKEIRPKLGNLINAMDAKIDETGDYEAAQSRGFQDGYKDGLEVAWAIAKRICRTSCATIDDLFDIAKSTVKQLDTWIIIIMLTLKSGKTEMIRGNIKTQKMQREERNTQRTQSIGNDKRNLQENIIG